MTQINASDTITVWRLAYNALDSDFRTFQSETPNLTVNDTGGLGSLSYNSNSGVLTYAGASNSDIRSLFSVGSGIIQYDSATGQFTSDTISIDVATTDSAGIASFPTAQFTVSGGGAVTIKDATTSAKGVASFNSSYFTTSSGAVSIAADAITYDKIQNVATANRLLGSTSAGGQVSEVQVQTGMVADDQITYSKIQNVAAANRLLGSTSAGGQVSEVQVQTAMIADDAVDRSKLKDEVSLIIYNSVGTAIKTMYGAGS